MRRRREFREEEEAAIFHERQMSRLALEFSRSWRDLTVKALDQTCVNY